MYQAATCVLAFLLLAVVVYAFKQDNYFRKTKKFLNEVANEGVKNEARLSRANDELRREAAMLTVKLTEARRRTIPVITPTGSYEINILPILVTSLNFDEDVKFMYGTGGEVLPTKGKVRMSIECSGEISTLRPLPAEVSTDAVSR